MLKIYAGKMAFEEMIRGKCGNAILRECGSKMPRKTTPNRQITEGNTMREMGAPEEAERMRNNNGSVVHK